MRGILSLRNIKNKEENVGEWNEGERIKGHRNERRSREERERERENTSRNETDHNVVRGESPSFLSFPISFPFFLSYTYCILFLSWYPVHFKYHCHTKLDTIIHSKKRPFILLLLLNDWSVWEGSLSNQLISFFSHFLWSFSQFP